MPVRTVWSRLEGRLLPVSPSNWGTRQGEAKEEEKKVEEEKEKTVEEQKEMEEGKEEEVWAHLGD